MSETCKMESRSWGLLWPLRAWNWVDILLVNVELSLLNGCCHVFYFSKLIKSIVRTTRPFHDKKRQLKAVRQCQMGSCSSDAKPERKKILLNTAKAQKNVHLYQMQVGFRASMRCWASESVFINELRELSEVQVMKQMFTGTLFLSIFTFL